MKIFSGRAPAGKSKRATAVNCLLINQFATPGLGSLMAGRIVAGTIQLLLALVGFGMVIWWMVSTTGEMLHAINEQPSETANYPWMGKIGFLIFGISWGLSWITSLSLLRDAPREEPAIPPVIPPPKL